MDPDLQVLEQVATTIQRIDIRSLQVQGAHSASVDRRTLHELQRPIQQHTDSLLAAFGVNTHAHFGERTRLFYNRLGRGFGLSVLLLTPQQPAQSCPEKEQENQQFSHRAGTPRAAARSSHTSRTAPRPAA